MAITTMYAGIEYRSRLEARYAAFFTGLGWTFTYEPFDADGYIPDFLIHGKRPLLVEVKPAVTMLEYEAPIEKMTNGLTRHWKHDLLVVGATPTPDLPTYAADSHRVAGLLGEAEIDWETDRVRGWNFQPGHWFQCTNCSATAIYHPEMTFVGRPCGCYDGDHYLGHLNQSTLRDAWNNACNDVKWRGRAA